ncbi:MAG TPA: sirohydrochlorin chelatase [Streptosporangiaceae bacterium]|nr:sirohydrochlorin chelatase [Streptosporangiaceae bacterium]
MSNRPGPAAARAATLVAVAHGSTNPLAAAAVTDLMALTAARAARAGLPGLPVRTAYLGHCLPSLPDVLAALGGPARARHAGPCARPEAVVLPLLLTGAYHSDTDLPAVLGEARGRLPWLGIRYGEPLGPHPGLLRALDRRMAEAIATAGVTGEPADTAVVLAAAGSSRPAANAAVDGMAADWQRACGWRSVVPAFASAGSPGPGEAVAGLLRAGAPQVVVATYLLAPGVFADQVRGQALAAGARAVSAPLGAAAELADVILERYRQAAPLGAGDRRRYA